MNKLERRKDAIKALKEGINATKNALREQRANVLQLEDKLENKRGELLYQTLLLKFDQIDQSRQEISDLIAKQNLTTDGHIYELEANDRIPDTKH